MKPEMTVRSLIHGMGFRYRLHRKDLPGKPDLVFAPRNKAKDDIFLMVPSEKNFFELPPIGTDVHYEAHVEPIVRELAMLLATGRLVRNAVSGEKFDDS